ncbi:hypothetical protein BpHYR1_050861 [Brachionus plicatilis]|uniref:Uncharacterized protein n=1 Tax=Brachionus plicatilis TaxID=10195 RepID=A0A3M7SQX9_BRAPC|nr:hypothetical protein BpHYR1_050861 [Brachionus plicatilis]
MITYQNPKYCVAHVKQRWLRRKRTQNSKIFFLNSGNRVNPFDPFEPHIINRGAKGVIQKFRENWVTIFEVFEQNGCEIINKKKYGHPIFLIVFCVKMALLKIEH